MATIDAISLLGWMSREEAIKFLREQCVFNPVLTEPEAEEIWNRYRRNVEQLAPREALAPTRIPITDQHEDAVAKEFLRRFRGAANILDVVKIDPLGLVVHQLHIVTERSDGYRAHVGSKRTWLQNALLCDAANAVAPMTIRAALNAVDVELPHGEFVFGFQPNQGFSIQQLARHVNVTSFGNRLLLWAGYHRSYARISSMAPDAIDRSLVVALTADGNFKVSPASPNHGEREMLTGARPPLFGDFFDERFFIKVKLRKKRFELQIRGQIVAIDEP